MLGSLSISPAAGPRHTMTCAFELLQPPQHSNKLLFFNIIKEAYGTSNSIAKVCSALPPRSVCGCGLLTQDTGGYPCDLYCMYSI